MDRTSCYWTRVLIIWKVDLYNERFASNLFYINLPKLRWSSVTRLFKRSITSLDSNIHKMNTSLNKVTFLWVVCNRYADEHLLLSELEDQKWILNSDCVIIENYFILKFLCQNFWDESVFF
jgi:hypothetical protein